MRKAPVLVVVMLLALALHVGESAPSPGGGPYVPHAPIRILRDADFNATNGVVSGSGTAGDPYVIAGWSIRHDAGAAIRILNTTAAFVVRDNLVYGRTGIAIGPMSSVAIVERNEIHTRGTAIEVEGANPLVRENALHAERDVVAMANGISLVGSNARVEANYILTLGIGIDADGASPSIVGNDIHHASVGIQVSGTTAANVTANVVTGPRETGIHLDVSIAANVSHNTVNGSWGTGIEVWLNKDVHVANNSVGGAGAAGVTFESTSGNFTGNVVVGGSADAVLVWNSPILLANNTIHDNLGIGFHFSGSATTDVRANVLTRNGVGIYLAGSELVGLRANVLANNTVGVSIPYEARASIALMAGNLVNGVNVDGTLDASQQVFFYKAANVTIEGQVRDSGFSAGYFGSLTAQGGVVLYEVDTANVNASVVSHHNVGVGVVNSFNVNVRGSLVANNLVGIRAEARLVPFQVPNCVVFVKDTNVTIDVDPVATIGIDARGCATFTLNATVSVVDTGIRVAGTANVGIENTTVRATTGVGLDLASGGDVVVRNGTYSGNRIGVRVGGGEATIDGATVVGNAEAGIRLENGARLELRRSNVSLNGEGIVDAEACLGAGTCGSLASEGNVVLGNGGDGVRVNGTSTFRDDRLLANRGAGARVGSASFLRVQALANEVDGAAVVGAFTVRDSRFDANGRHGFALVGEGSLRNATFNDNGEAGIHAQATYVTGLELDVSRNFDGILFQELVSRGPSTPSTSVPGLLRLLPTHALAGEPLHVHLSTLLDNRRDAVRANGALVNASHNYWGPLGPAVNVADTVGAFQNGVSPTVRTAPFYTSPAMDEEVLTVQNAEDLPDAPEPVAPSSALTVYYDDFGWCPSSCAATDPDASATTGSALGGVAYETSAASPWTVGAEGVDGNGMAAVAGLPPAPQASDLVVRLNVTDAEPAGFFYEFRWRHVGKPAGPSTLGDALRFHVERIVRDADGTITEAESEECLHASGLHDWTAYDSRRLFDAGAPSLCAHLPPGEYVLRFRHERDGGAALTDAGAWIDHLKLDRRPQWA